MTDRQTLKWIVISKKSFGRFARWKFRLIEFEFEIHHRSVRKNLTENILSCFLTTQPVNPDWDYEIPTYKANEIYENNDKEGDIKVVLFTIRAFVSAQEKDVHCHIFDKEADVPDNR